MANALAVRVAPGGVVPRRNLGYWQRSWTRLRANSLGLTMGAIIVAEVLIAIFAPIIAQNVFHSDPDRQDLSDIFGSPGQGHLLGTDQLGRDILVRMLYGARVSLGVAGLAVTMTVTLGTLVGLTAGFYGRWVDTLLMRFVDVLLAIPPIFFYILLAILFRPNAVGLALVLGSIGWAGTARLVRSEVLATRGLDFVLASRAVGAQNRRIMFRHILPATIPVILVAASISVAAVILTEAALSFLGLGIVPPDPSWGNMITAARVYFSRAIWLALFPGIAIFVTVLAINLFGNALRDALDQNLN